MARTTDAKTDIAGGLDSPSADLPVIADVSDYWALLKPRVMSLVVFTALMGLLAAPGTIHPWLGFISVLCIAIAAGASGALNMWYEADIDAMMKRTRNRPIPAGRIEPGAVLGFGLVLAVASVVSLGLFVNVVAAALLAFTIFFYAVIYTVWLKRRTAQNIVIGGAAGAFPPVVAWASVTGSIDFNALVLFAIIFMWTPPHFWALALFIKGDYEKAGIPMLPVVAGEAETRKQILIYAILLAPIGVLPWLLGFAGNVYGASAIGLGVLFVVGAWRTYREREEVKAARALFSYSILYLFGLFGVLGLEHLVRGWL